MLQYRSCRVNPDRSTFIRFGCRWADAPHFVRKTSLPIWPIADRPGASLAAQLAYSWGCSECPVQPLAFGRGVWIFDISNI